MERPSVARESIKAIVPVAIEVVAGTALLGWAMLSLPSVLQKTLHLSNQSAIASVLQLRSEDMLRFIAEQFATVNNPVSNGFNESHSTAFCDSRLVHPSQEKLQ